MTDEGIKVPFAHLSSEAAFFTDAAMPDIEAVVRSGHYLFGPMSEKLEERLSQMFGRPVVLVGSGTDALALSLKAIGVGLGDKVAIPTFSALPTAVAVKMTGAQPVYADVDAGMTMDPNALVRLLSREHGVKAAIPVHLFGNPAAMGLISQICREHGVAVVEDCAQAFGAHDAASVSLLGSIGCAGALSFYPTKNLGALGDAGAVVCANKTMADDIKQLRFYGQEGPGKRIGRRSGMNSRIDEIQAAVLLTKMNHLAKTEARRRGLHTVYENRLRDTHTLKRVVWRQGAMPHLYPVLAPRGDREAFRKAMARRGVETAVHYDYHLREAAEGMPGAFSDNAAWYATSIVSIPFSPWMTDEEVEIVLSAASESAKETA